MPKRTKLIALQKKIGKKWVDVKVLPDTFPDYSYLNLEMSFMDPSTSRIIFRETVDGVADTTLRLRNKKANKRKTQETSV